MLVRNHTPFVPLVLASMDVAGRMFGVFVLRGTFRIVNQAPLRPDPEQAPLVQTDVFHGEIASSSLYLESDLAPFKPRSDVYLNAVAHARGGWAEPSWLVRARIGVLDKTLRVCGPRRWVREGGAYRLTEPEACTEVPIRYERAFGGVWSDEWGDPDVCQENPVGVGHVRAGARPTAPELPAPQIESPADPIVEIGERHRPEGLGPIFRAWLPRRALGGTYDERWTRERWPLLPLDFDFAFHNCAHGGLVYPGYLEGDEEVTLEGLHPEGEIRFSLPALGAAIALRLGDGSTDGAPMRLDTVAIDVPGGLVHLTWRAVRRGGLDAIREIDVRTSGGRVVGSRDATGQTPDAIVVGIGVDVCWTPIGPLKVPVPYFSVATFADATEVSNDVNFAGFAACMNETSIPLSTGTEAGLGGGLVSGGHQGPCHAITFSGTVRANGRNVVRHLSLMWMNCGGDGKGVGNSIGIVICLRNGSALLDYMSFVGDSASDDELQAAVRDLRLSPPSTDTVGVEVEGSLWDLVDWAKREAVGLEQQVVIDVKGLAEMADSVGGFTWGTILGDQKVLRQWLDWGLAERDFWTTLWNNPSAALGGAADVTGSVLRAQLDPTIEAYEKRGVVAAVFQAYLDFGHVAKLGLETLEERLPRRLPVPEVPEGAPRGSGVPEGAPQAKGPGSPEAPPVEPPSGGEVGGKGEKKGGGGAKDGEGVRVESKPIPRSLEHKKLRWREYNERMVFEGRKPLPYEEWSRRYYEPNQVRAKMANRAVNAYRDKIGWGQREVPVDVDVKVDGQSMEATRILDIGEKNAEGVLTRGVEFKTGYIAMDDEIAWEIERDARLVEKGVDISWVFTNEPSKGVLKALDDAGIFVDYDPPR